MISRRGVIALVMGGVGLLLLPVAGQGANGHANSARGLSGRRRAATRTAMPLVVTDAHGNPDA